MNNEERVKLVFETISKIVGFEIKPNKDFYIWSNGNRIKYHIRSDLTLMYEYSKGHYEKSNFTVLPILNGGYKLEEIKEPLVTEEEKNFLRQFKFEELEISNWISSPILFMFDKNDTNIASIYLTDINVSFDRLKKYRRYSRKELEL